MHIFNKEIIKVNFLIKFGIIAVLIVFGFDSLEAQPNYSAWHFRDGNYQANKRANSGFYQQNIDSFIVKWATPEISGDVIPLIGNLVNNSFLGISETQPLEMTALMGDNIVIMSGSGKLLKKQKLPAYAQNVKSFTVLFDSLSVGFENFSNNTVLIGSESIEFFNPNSKDTLAHSYIFGYDADMDSVKVVKRLSIDLRDYKPNVSASIKPFYGRRVNGRMMVYSIVDMNRPIVGQGGDPEDYFRGFAQFYDDDDGALFPLPDMKDQLENRIHLTADVGLYQPSMQILANNYTGVLLPWQSVNLSADSSFLGYSINERLGGANYRTYADSSYLVGFQLTNSNVEGNFSPVNLPINGNRPIIRPVYAELTNVNSVKTNYILVAEQYSGIDGSEGESRLHLFNAAGSPITQSPQSKNPPLLGGKNHYWSIAVGNVDGVPGNSWGKYFPNNPGNEIIVTQSTRESVFPESHLFIMRLHTGLPIVKPTPSGDTLYPFDTIATARVNGWLAAVADLDLNSDGKDEILLVDGSKLMVMRLRDYQDINFRLGYPLDTVFVKEFRKQTISSVAIADLEGDGRPDIIVTTFDSTYVIGQVIENSIKIDCPNKDGISEFCINDTINLSWQNIIISQPYASIKFERTDEIGNPLDTIQLFETYDNNTDSISIDIFAGSDFYNNSNERIVYGRFIIQGTDFPEKVKATSCLISIHKPEITLNSTLPVQLAINDVLDFSANVSCVDSVTMMWSFSHNNQWLDVEKLSVQNSAIVYNGSIPCIDSLFSCDQSSFVERYLKIMLISHRNNYLDTNYFDDIEIIPAKLPFSIDEKSSADPSVIIRWNSSNLLSSNCRDLSISVSADGFTYSEIANVNSTDGVYKWNVPIDVPNSLIFRLCCIPQACLRSDTVVTGISPKYVDIIAPNPFNPDLEIMEFVYKIPNDQKISISIYDQSNRLVKRVVNSEQRVGGYVYTDRWDGRREDGSVTANGLYYLILELDGGSREIHQIFVGK